MIIILFDAVFHTLTFKAKNMGGSGYLFYCYIFFLARYHLSASKENGKEEKEIGEKEEEEISTTINNISCDLLFILCIILLLIL